MLFPLCTGVEPPLLAPHAMHRVSPHTGACQAHSQGHCITCDSPRASHAHLLPSTTLPSRFPFATEVFLCNPISSLARGYTRVCANRAARQPATYYCICKVPSAAPNVSSRCSNRIAPAALAPMHPPATCCRVQGGGCRRWEAPVLGQQGLSGRWRGARATQRATLRRVGAGPPPPLARGPTDWNWVRCGVVWAGPKSCRRRWATAWHLMCRSTCLASPGVRPQRASQALCHDSAAQSRRAQCSA